jgi:hypothetical protein
MVGLVETMLKLHGRRETARPPDQQARRPQTFGPV